MSRLVVDLYSGPVNDSDNLLDTVGADSATEGKQALVLRAVAEYIRDKSHSALDNLLDDDDKTKIDEALSMGDEDTVVKVATPIISREFNFRVRDIPDISDAKYDLNDAMRGIRKSRNESAHEHHTNEDSWEDKQRAKEGEWRLARQQLLKKSKEELYRMAKDLGLVVGDIKAQDKGNLVAQIMSVKGGNLKDSAQRRLAESVKRV